MAPLYREHRIYCPQSDRVALFVCLERLADSHFAVSQAEFLYEGDDLRKRTAEIAALTIELMFDEDRIEGRIEFYPTIGEAIASHQHAFEDFEARQ